ncbi:MAG: DUF4747 family protein [Phycisphaeraceae bacterium]|nr:DUF4747 family protein [Phycisphaeraceae bacterium]
MPANDYEFDLYRLNIRDDSSLFASNNNRIRSDESIKQILSAASTHEFDHERRERTRRYIWFFRDYVESSSSTARGDALYLVFGRSTPEHIGKILTDDGVAEGVSTSFPPPAIDSVIVFDLKRHLVAVQHNSEMMLSKTWLKSFHQILAKASHNLGYTSTLTIEPVPSNHDILRAFHSFDKLTQLKVHLLIPNPDITRPIKRLFEELRTGGIRDYVQDMKNPNGLNKAEGELPHASASMAQAGYKRGDVTMRGVIDGESVKKVTGNRPASAIVPEVKDYVRGMRDIAKTKEGKEITTKILAVIDTIETNERDSDEM